MGGCLSKPPVSVGPTGHDLAQVFADISARGVRQADGTEWGVSGASRAGGSENSFRGVSGPTRSRGSVDGVENRCSGEDRGSGDVRVSSRPLRPAYSVSGDRHICLPADSAHSAGLDTDDRDCEGGFFGSEDNQVVFRAAEGTAGAFACTGFLELQVRNKRLTAEGQSATETVTVKTTQLPLSRPLPVYARFAQMTALLSTMLSCDLVEVKFTPEELHWHVSVAEQLGTLSVDGRLLEESYGKAREEVSMGRKLCPLNMLRPEDDVMVIPDMQLSDEYKDHPCVAGEPNVRLFAAAWLTSSDDPGSSRRRGFNEKDPLQNPGRERRNYGILYLADKSPRDPKYMNDIKEVLEEAARVVAMTIEEYKLSMIKEVLVLDRKQRLGPDRTQAGTTGVSSYPRLSVGDGKSPCISDDGMSESSEEGIGKMISAVDCFQDGCMLLECIVGTKYAVGWNVVHVNDSLSRQLECDTKSMIGHGFWEYYLADIMERSFTNSLVRQNRPFELSATFQNTLHPSPVMQVLEFRPAVALAGSGNVTPVCPRDDVDSQQSLSPRKQVSRSASKLQQTNSIRSMQSDQTGVDAGSSSGLHLGSQMSNLLSSLSVTERDENESLYNIRGSGNRMSGEVKRYYFAHLKADSIGAIGVRGRSLQLSKEAPRVFKDIRLGPLIGRGAYGRVYRGNWNGNIVAVKVITSEQKIAESRVKETVSGTNPGDAHGLHEAVLSSALSHPNVLHTYQYSFRHVPASGTGRSRVRNARRSDGDVEGADGEARAKEGTRLAAASHAETSEQFVSELWLVSEFCNRGPLLTAIENGLFMIHASNMAGSSAGQAGSQTNLIYILQTAQEISAAMEYLHGHDVVHGDLTGGNVLLQSSDKDGRGFTAKVVDFGLSRVCAGGSLKTSKMGCAEYMPPELITRGLLTKAGDVYAFGVILWELYVGKRAWANVEPSDVLDRVAKGHSLEYPPHTPRRLKILGERCLSVSVEARPQFADVVHEVNTILDDTMAILRNFLGNSSNG